MTSQLEIDTTAHPAWLGRSVRQCACIGLPDTAHCHLGQHARCPVITARGPETYLQTHGRGPYTAVWLADRTCHRVCQCQCHRGQGQIRLL